MLVMDKMAKVFFWERACWIEWSGVLVVFPEQSGVAKGMVSKDTMVLEGEGRMKMET